MVRKRRSLNRWLLGISLAPVLSLLVGCGQTPPPRFHANLPQMANSLVSREQQEQVADILDAMFGTPDEPFVLPESGLDLNKIKMSAGPVHSSPQGQQRGLFRLHCAHCHGISGVGLGPTAVFLKPYPRDYRRGLYKFKSTPANIPPTESDLMRTLVDGIPGTAMPSFKLLDQAELDSLVEYVKYLSVRGQVELALIAHVSQELSPDQSILPSGEGQAADPQQVRKLLVDKVLRKVTQQWKNATSQVTQTPPPPADFGSEASIVAGKEVFYGKGGCVKCHGPTALGDGQMVWDLWNEDVSKIVKNLPNIHQQLENRREEVLQKLDAVDNDQKRDNLEYQLSGLKVEIKELAYVPNDVQPPRESQPRNLRQGIFRGGREPYLLYYRVHDGIYASGMSASSQTPGMTEADMWHLVDYLLDLPYQPGSQYHTDKPATFRERL